MNRAIHLGKNVLLEFYLYDILLFSSSSINLCNRGLLDWYSGCYSDTLHLSPEQEWNMFLFAFVFYVYRVFSYVFIKLKEEMCSSFVK